MYCSPPGFPVTNSRSLLKLTSIELVMPANHLILCRPLLLPPSIFPIIRVFSNEAVLRIRWTKHFLMMYSAYKLNKQGDNIQPWRTPFPIWNQSVVPYLVLTVACWLAHRFLGRQVRWSGSPICLRIFHNFFCYPHSQRFCCSQWSRSRYFSGTLLLFDDPMDVGNLSSVSSAFSKSSSNIWKFLVHLLLKPSLENFEHYFASVWDECNCVIGWTFFDIAFLWNWNESWPFPFL